MNRPPSFFRFCSQIWLQNFRLQPVRTVIGTVLSFGLLIALVFFSVFIFSALLVISLGAILYFRFFGSATAWPGSSQSRTTAQQDSATRGKILEGEFREVDKASGAGGDSDR